MIVSNEECLMRGGMRGFGKGERNGRGEVESSIHAGARDGRDG